MIHFFQPNILIIIFKLLCKYLMNELYNYLGIKKVNEYLSKD